MVDRVPDRPRRGQATTEAILHSAVEVFTRQGYRAAGVREIAGRAGCTAMLVNRYFGSKEGLFAAAVASSFGPPAVAADQPPRLGLPTGDEPSHQDTAARCTTLAADLLEHSAPDRDHLDPLLLLIRSADDPRALEIIRASIGRHAPAPLEELFGARRENLELARAVIAGVWLLRALLQVPALTERDADTLPGLLGTVFEVLAAPPAPPEQPRRPVPSRRPRPRRG